MHFIPHKIPKCAKPTQALLTPPPPQRTDPRAHKTITTLPRISSTATASPNGPLNPLKSVHRRWHCRPRCPPVRLPSLHHLGTTLERSSCLSCLLPAPNAFLLKLPHWASLASSPDSFQAAPTPSQTPQTPTSQAAARPSPTPLPLRPLKRNPTSSPRAWTRPRFPHSGIRLLPAGSSLDRSTPYPWPWSPTATIVRNVGCITAC
jgi:hypothetical protein